ncbi:hypothetical protein E8L99_17285 [Phreatobacter aquaticus]|uniref:Dihydrofolate reductase n=1 Tax=Phreatobacter aquaticus TaxID=2570229 RepID=A0A4D7QN53_9HYPH|nr:hypothetical protein [Phreatobacter aquaticus]QCK87383.1 hypothetical protein E8L99_17285 [Phreatobacter aquaticus]
MSLVFHDESRSRPPGVEIEGHAIVSADGNISEADGTMPKALMNEADWALFQSALDRAAIVVLGRLGHQAHPNPGRRRLVLTGSVVGLVADPADPLAWCWNPATLAFEDVLERLEIAAGTVAVTGGTRVFDHFLGIGYDRFALSTATKVLIPDGRPCFTSDRPEPVLERHGLVSEGGRLIDAVNDVTAALWTRRHAAGTV